MALPVSHALAGQALTCPHSQNSLAGSSPQYSEGDDELIKHVQRRASSFTPESPEQILQMQQMRHEFTGKLVPRTTENC